MVEKFYEKRDEHLKIIKGNPTNISYLLRTSHASFSGARFTTEDIPLNTSTQFLFGNLQRVNNQLFVDSLPTLGIGSYLQIRQDTKQNDAIDVEVVIQKSSGNELIKDFNWHHQPNNKSPIYHTNFQIGLIQVDLSIGSGVSFNDLLNDFSKKIF